MGDARRPSCMGADERSRSWATGHGITSARAPIPPGSVYTSSRPLRQAESPPCSPELHFDHPRRRRRGAVPPRPGTHSAPRRPPGRAAPPTPARRCASSPASPIDLVLCDLQMPGLNGLELVRQVHELQPDLPCIVMTGYNTPEKSVEALQAGAFWYLEKPFEHEPPRRRARGSSTTRSRTVGSSPRTASSTRSSAPAQVRQHHRQERQPRAHPARRRRHASPTPRARCSSPARAAPARSSWRARCTTTARARRPPARSRVNCGAIPEELLEIRALRPREGRLHERGQPSRGPLRRLAQRRHDLPGRDRRHEPESAGEAAARAAGAHLRARRLVEDAEGRRARDRRDPPGPAEKLIEEGRFREDLFYRLNVLPIEVPSPCGTASRTSRSWCTTSSTSRATSAAPGSPASPTRPCSASSTTTGPATSASSRTRSSASRSCSRRRRHRGRPTCPAQIASAEPDRAGLGAARRPSTGLDFNAVVARFEADLIGQALDHTHWNKNRAAGPARAEPHDADREDQEARPDVPPDPTTESTARLDRRAAVPRRPPRSSAAQATCRTFQIELACNHRCAEASVLRHARRPRSRSCPPPRVRHVRLARAERESVLGRRRECGFVTAIATDRGSPTASRRVQGPCRELRPASHGESGVFPIRWFAAWHVACFRRRMRRNAPADCARDANSRPSAVRATHRARDEPDRRDDGGHSRGTGGARES